MCNKHIIYKEKSQVAFTSTSYTCSGRCGKTSPTQMPRYHGHIRRSLGLALQHHSSEPLATTPRGARDWLTPHSIFQFELTLKEEEKENALKIQGCPGLVKTSLAPEEIIVSVEKPCKVKGYDCSGKGRR